MFGRLQICSRRTSARPLCCWRRWPILLLVIMSATVPALEGSLQQEHAEAVAMARRGNLEPALQRLVALHQRAPQEPIILYDLVRISAWAGRDQAVLDYFNRIESIDIPPDVIEPAAKAARNLGDFATALALYQRVLDRDPNRIAAELGWILVKVDSGEVDSALARVEPLARRYPKNTEVLMVSAYVWENENNFVRAAGLYHWVLRLDPQHAAARRGLINAVREMGAPHLAHDMVQDYRDDIDHSELQRILSDRIAVQIRWGELPQPSPEQRYRDTDIALRLSDDAHGQDWQMLDLRDEFTRRLAFDRMVALRDRFRMREVVVIHEQLVAAQIEAPDYALMAAADAYLYLRQPAIARDIYRQVLALDPQHHNATVSLFFALTDLDDFSSALPLSEELAQRYPVWRRDTDGRVTGPNGAKLEADLLNTRAKAFADKLAIAQSELEDMLALAPGNDDIRVVLANVYRWRGWPRRSLAQYQIVQNQRPDDLDAKVGVANAQMDLRRYRPVAATVAGLNSEYPERTQVQKLARDWELYRRPELYINWRVAESDGPQIGTDDVRIDSYLYSSPLDYNYRFFLHDHYARADLPESEPENHRFGVGLEYSYRDYRLTTELSAGAADNNDVGIGINGDWRVNDYLTLGAGYESNSNDVPLRAIGADIDTERYGVSASYRWHESQQMSLAYNYYGFDDGNRRRAISGSLSRRVLNLPSYKLDAQLWLYASDNSLLGAPYFNPETDASVSLSLNNDWRVWRSYERSFHHSFGATIGSYWQKGFGSDGTWALNYQHRWALSDALKLSYGIARSRRVFDGAPEFENAFFGDVDYRF